MKRSIALAVFIAASSLQAQDNEGLIKAAQQGDLAAVQAAVAGGASPNWVNAAGGTALTAAWFWPEITQFLIDKGADPNAGDNPALVMASRYYSVDVMKILLKAGADPNKAQVVKVDMAATYRKMIADENAKGKDANKAMIKAYETLLGRAPAPTTITNTAVQMAVSFTSCRECLELLLAAGAKTDFVSPAGGNLIHALAFGWMPNTQRIRMVQANTPAMRAAGAKVPEWYHNIDPSKFGSASEMIALLVGKGVSITALDRLQNSPLQTALSRDSLVTDDLLLGLINNGANVREDIGRRGSMMVQAAAYGGPDVMAAMVAKGADVNHEDAFSDGAEKWKGFTALINAAKTNNLATARWLIEHGAKVTAMVEGTGSVYSHRSRVNCVGYDVKNKSVIYFAIESGNLEMVQLIAGAPGANWRGVKPLEYKEFKGMTHTMSAADFGNRCFTFGAFDPAGYAKRLGLPEIEGFLKANRIG